VITDADIEILNAATGVHYSSQTNGDGIYSISILPPGEYRVQISKAGFKTLIKPGIVLNVQSALALNFTLPIGARSESITVEAGASFVNTTDGSVSTVIDQKFVENTPLNGRSFQSLILLSPGTVTNSPQRASSLGSTGEFSVNGQRTESNYYTVDGVSANTGIAVAANGSGPSGSISASTALGTTQSLVSVDALQEFRVDSSTYSAEYGRNPGGQFSMVTRSGTNDLHASVFEYFRNEALDANSWFNDNTVPITKRTPERQNDFGGTVGGPIRIPYLYKGTNQSFFFFSYEGLRLLQPVASSINDVPDVALRQSTSGPLQQALNAFPLPTPNAPDLGNGLGEYIGSWSNPSQIDATSIRVDQNLGQRSHLFFRFSDSPSSIHARGSSALSSTPSIINASTYSTQTYTLGAAVHVAQALDNEFRINFSRSNVLSHYASDDFGGALSADLPQLQGISDEATTTISLIFGAYRAYLENLKEAAEQKQWNVIDTVSMQRGRHALKLGIDWRRLAPFVQQSSPSLTYDYLNSAAVTANSVSEGFAQAFGSYYPLYTNFSAFGQDEWKVGPRFNASIGIRWDVNPAPGVSQGSMPYTVTGLYDYSSMTLAPQGTPLWKTSWFNFAPRLGVAYVLNSNPERETVIRGGGGVFFDTGQQTGNYGFEGPGFASLNEFGTIFGEPAGFPVPAATFVLPLTQSLTAPYGTVYANPSHLQLPYTLQWNASLEQALGRSQSFTVTYVGANGRKLLEEDYSNISTYNPNFTDLFVFKNGLTSSYNALQVKYQRQVIRGLQALASYTWSHAMDYGSYNAAFPYEHGNSDYDIRDSAAAAVSYDLPHSEGSSRLHLLTADWGVDGRFTARTGFPITLTGNTVIDPATGLTYFGGLNLNPGPPLFLYGPRSTYPGGRRINSAAFSLPATGQAGDAPRNFIDGFGAVQTDIAIRRAFPIHDGLHGQFRAEAFNVLNHPNFGLVNATYGNVQFGEATAILSQSLGTLSPLYQMGGPRSLQLTFRLTY
jgi:hypothetical protein